MYGDVQGDWVLGLEREAVMNQKKGTVVSCFLLLLLGGCATPMNYMATGGSRADGTVKLSYQYGGFQVPVADPEQAVLLAKKKCAAWGYTGAEPFGGEMQQCTAFNQFGCVQFLVTTEFQCLGGPSK